MDKKRISRKKAIEVLRCCKREFEEKYGVTELGIFGSVARDEAKQGSRLCLTLTMTLNIFFQPPSCHFAA